MKSFLSKIKAFFMEFLGSSKWEHAASATLAMVAPLLQSIVAFTAGEPDAQIVGNIVSEIETDLGDVAHLIDQVSTGAKSSSDVESEVTTILDGVSTNLGKLLTDGHIKDPRTLAKVEAIVKTVVGEVDAIVQEFHPTPTPPPPAPIVSPSGTLAAAGASTSSAPATNTSPNASLVHRSDQTIPPAE